MEIIKKARREWIQYPVLKIFQSPKKQGFWSFEINEDGSLLDPSRQAVLEYAIEQGSKRGMKPFRTFAQRMVQEDAIGQCSCGNTLQLRGFTNHCGSCGRNYNRHGQELAPREQWGEEFR